jgi:hypothetical protein
MAMLLRPWNAGSNTAADHISVVKAALAQLSSTQADRRPGRAVMVAPTHTRRPSRQTNVCRSPGLVHSPTRTRYPG